MLTLNRFTHCSGVSIVDLTNKCSLKTKVPLSLNVNIYLPTGFSQFCKHIPSHWHRSGVFIVNFEHISHIVLVLTLSMYISPGFVAVTLLFITFKSNVDCMVK